MASFRIFKRTWWADDACTQPEAGPKRYSRKRASSEDEARALCRALNRRDFGTTMRGPRGAAWEYEAA